MALLLLSGVPGTGKTEAGDELVREHGFAHLDIESFLLSAPRTCADLLAQVKVLMDENRDAVVTWGFQPAQDVAAIRAVQAMGFKLVWFGGNDEAAHREYARRNAEKGILLEASEEAWRVQMRNIGLFDIESLGPVRLNPFNESGRFLDRAVIAERLLALR